MIDSRLNQGTLCLCSMFFCLAASANDRMPDLPHADGDIVVDGHLDDDLWVRALRVPIDIETTPGDNLGAAVETVALLIENGDSLFVAFDARDPDPSQIRAYLRDRDSAYQDDFVGIVIDTFNDQRRAFEFFVNPLGVQMDLTRDEINRREDDAWDAIWDSAGRVTDRGYIVELEIPFSQLRFPREQGPQTWGIDLLRSWPREHRYLFRSNELDRDVDCYLCQISKVRGFAKAKAGRDQEIVPTVTAARTAQREDPVIDPLVSAEPDVDVGLTLRWGLTPELTASLALNPDFSQVEADVAQLDVNNQFALFFPEKRPFFLEGADYFRTPIQAIFTRTVADPEVGVKLTGKQADNTFGVFFVNDRLTNLVFPGSFGSDSDSLSLDNRAVVGRYNRDFGDGSSLGTLVTARAGDDYRNIVGGVDGRWKINDRHSVSAQLLRSSTEYPAAIATEFAQPPGNFAGNALSGDYDFRSRNWFSYIRHAALSPGFRADSGFVPRVNYQQQVIGLGRRWHGEPDDWWTRIQLNGDWDITHDDDGRLLEKELEAYVSVNGPWQSYVQFGGLTRKVLFDDILFPEDKVSLYAEMKPFSGLSFGIWTRFGDQVDFDNSRLGEQWRAEPSVDWNVNEHLLLRLRSTFVTLTSKAGPNIFEASVHDLRMTWQFSVRSFLRLTVQHRDVERNPDQYLDTVEAREQRVGRQLLYSWKLNPQTVFFLGYSDSLLDDDDLDRMTTTDRTLFLKVGYAWLP